MTKIMHSSAEVSFFNPFTGINEWHARIAYEYDPSLLLTKAKSYFLSVLTLSIVLLDVGYVLM